MVRAALDGLRSLQWVNHFRAGSTEADPRAISHTNRNNRTNQIRDLSYQAAGIDRRRKVHRREPDANFDRRGKRGERRGVYDGQVATGE